jgi:hypothetical protein
VIGYLFLSAGAIGSAVAVYSAAPAGHGVHRYVAPRQMLRAEAARHEAEADGLACKLHGLTSELDGVMAERDEAIALLGKAERLVTDLEEQLVAFDALCAENTQLRADRDNARAMRQLLPGPSPADDASSLPDELQEFADETAVAWRASA